MRTQLDAPNLPKALENDKFSILLVKWLAELKKAKPVQFLQITPQLDQASISK